MNYFICLLDSSWLGQDYDQGDILLLESGKAPPAVSWASFAPPPGLPGTPTLTHVHDDGSGDLEFVYSLKGITDNLVVRCRVGLPLAEATLAEERQAKDGFGPPAPASKPKLEFGAGVVETSGRSYVGWAPGGSRPTPPKKPKDFDPPLTLNLPSYNAWNTE